MSTLRSATRFGRTWRAGALLGLGGLVGACVGHGPAVVAPVPEPGQEARSAENRTRIEHPTRVIFRWELNERGTRMHGRGVASLASPYRARLDLFLSNGEGVVSAALVGEDLRLPAGAPKDILPPPDLMWAVLGVFRPEHDTELLGGDHLDDGGIRLRYRCGDGQGLRYELQNGRVVSLEILEGGHTTQRVRLQLSESSRYPAKATYRNLVAFRELKLTRESVEQVDSFPSDIWDPAR